MLSSPLHRSPQVRFSGIVALCLFLAAPFSGGARLPKTLDALLENHCLKCHDDVEMKGDLDLFSLKWNLKNSHTTDIWVKVHDRLASGEMPPKKKSKLSQEERVVAVAELAGRIIEEQETMAMKQGRSVSRRLNRFASSTGTLTGLYGS